MTRECHSELSFLKLINYLLFLSSKLQVGAIPVRAHGFVYEANQLHANLYSQVIFI